jgi:glycosyltransferase involved in cell wall biosynthesis
MARICHISIVGPADDQRVFLRECRTLAKAGHDVSMIVRHDREEVRDGVRFIPVRPARNRFVRMIRNVPLALWLALRQRADLYHVHDPELALAGVVLKLLTRAKIVYGVREDHPRMMRHKFYMPWLLRVVMSYLVQFVEQFSSRLFFNAVVAVTDDIGDNFRRHPRVLIIKNYPILTPAPSRKEDGPFTLLYVGSMTKIRGLLGMIETIERMDGDARLLLAGTFGPAELEQEARAMPGWARVDYAGYVDVLQSPEFFARADVGLVVVLPERHHLTALPLKMFDYMGARLPVIASNFPLWSEIVEGNACGICVDPLDPDAMAAAARRLRDDPALRREMGERGRRAVEEKYNWDSEAKRLLALYDELLA